MSSSLPRRRVPQPRTASEVDRPLVNRHGSYHPGGGISEGMKRARRPYAAKNFVVGGAVALVTVNLYLYSMFKIKQDDFSDISLPAAGKEGNPVTTPDKKHIV